MSSWEKKKQTNPKTKTFFILCLLNVSLWLDSEYVFQARMLQSIFLRNHIWRPAIAICLLLVMLMMLIVITSQGVVQALHCIITMLYLSPLPQEVICGETLEDHANILLLIQILSGFGVSWWFLPVFWWLQNDAPTPALSPCFPVGHGILLWAGALFSPPLLYLGIYVSLSISLFIHPSVIFYWYELMNSFNCL